jgi:photosystem II stability/assembly factor-like uncharacterized protein
MLNRSQTWLLCMAIPLCAQTPLENTGKPMRLVYECTAADTLAVGLGCSEDDPCPVYLELANVEAAGNKIFLSGNLHTPTSTLYSVLLESEDAGATWAEPHPRARASGLDQIQFIDFQNGWISGANLQGAPRDPFLLITTDGGRTWRERPIFEESRVAAIERFWFDSPEHGTLLIDARLDNGKRELYETSTGGEIWAMQHNSAESDRFPKEKQPGALAWRLRTDAATHSYVIEKSENSRWQKVASFLVSVATCKQ